MKPIVFFTRKKLKKNFFLKKKNSNPMSVFIRKKWTPKKTHFPVLPIFIFLKFFFQGLVLGLVGLIDAKGIDVAQPIWS